MLQFYQRQVQIQNTPVQLFEKIPVLFFEPEQKDCPLDHQKLYVLKTDIRLVKALGIGTFYAHQTIRYCKKHPELGVWKSNDLNELVAPNSNIAYNVMVEIGKLRFMDNRQVSEIYWQLLEKSSIMISPSEIELLIDKFIFYLAVVHQESSILIKEQINAQGGYILHLDASCEGDSPKLTSSIDSISGFVLYSAKLNSENKDDVIAFLEEIKQRFGIPHAVISDMGKGIEAAIPCVFEKTKHFICHFHFLAAIGKLLFEKENTILRNALSKAGISGKLKALRRKMKQDLRTFTIENIEDHLKVPERLGKSRESTEILAYYLILWILDHAADGNGYGFPFDQRYLYFYERLKIAQNFITEIQGYYSSRSENDMILWKIFHLVDPIVKDRTIQDAVASYKSKLAVFSELRHALGIAPEQQNNGLSQMSIATSEQELQNIRTAVNEFMDNLKQKIKDSSHDKLHHCYLNVKERIERYWDKLFADPLIFTIDGKERMFFVHRTNNIMENQFRRFNYSYRRIHGNRSVRRNLENIPEQITLVENLKNPDYVKLVFKDESKIAKRFSEVDKGKIIKLLLEHRQDKEKLCSTKIKNFIRQPELRKRLLHAFIAVAA